MAMMRTCYKVQESDIGHHLQDIPDPVHLCIFDYVRLKKIMRHQLYPPGLQGAGFLGAPDLFCLNHHPWSVLQYKIQVRVLLV